jgi:hypothetical protein
MNGYFMKKLLTFIPLTLIGMNLSAMNNEVQLQAILHKLRSDYLMKQTMLERSYDGFSIHACTPNLGSDIEQIRQEIDKIQIELARIQRERESILNKNQNK